MHVNLAAGLALRSCITAVSNILCHQAQILYIQVEIVNALRDPQIRKNAKDRVTMLYGLTLAGLRLDIVN